VGDTLDTHRSSLRTFCEPACDTTDEVDLNRSLRGSTLDTHRSSLRTFCELACDTTGEVDLKRSLHLEHVGYS
jgi:hypothetical protein